MKCRYAMISNHDMPDVSIKTLNKKPRTKTLSPLEWEKRDQEVYLTRPGVLIPYPASFQECDGEVMYKRL